MMYDLPCSLNILWRNEGDRKEQVFPSPPAYPSVSQARGWGPSSVEDLCRKTDDVIKIFVRRTDQRQTEIPLNTKVTDVLCRCKVRLSKVNGEAQLHTQTNEKVCHA